ncbi:MAG: LLM class flavin-dependent oxidoreductase [Chloroflexota bacterium]|nr:LLM class flavin-dependent oxidoreductase [Chloroflexota bacterium]
MTTTDQVEAVPTTERFPHARNRPLRSWHGRKMALGLMLPISELGAYGDAPPRFADMLAIVRAAEAVGFDAVWVPDHLIMRHVYESNVTRGVWECWTTLAALAAATEGIRFASFVTCTSFRSPGLIAKLAESLDEISAGRFILGLGAGWHQPEYEMFGFPFNRRVTRFEEALKIVHDLLRQGQADFEGEYTRVIEAPNIPRGPSAALGGPPILIGGTGPRMLRLTAIYADAWNNEFHPDPATTAGHIHLLDDACAGVGRDPTTLLRTTGANLAMPGYLGRRPNPIRGEPTVMAEAINSFSALNIGHFICGLDPCTPAAIEHFGHVIETLDANLTEEMSA